jgi:hypothetical protein
MGKNSWTSGSARKACFGRKTGRRQAGPRSKKNLSVCTFVFPLLWPKNNVSNLFTEFLKKKLKRLHTLWKIHLKVGYKQFRKITEFF